MSNASTGTVKPFLDNRETIGMNRQNVSEPKLTNNQSNSDREQKSKRVQHNRRRSHRMSSLKREALRLSQAIAAYTERPDVVFTLEELKGLTSLKKQLEMCCVVSLYREHHYNSAIEYIGSHTCKHKACPVCNYNRSKQLRRKYMQFLKAPENKYLLEEHNLMHLTLTVPHTAEHGWRGEKFYATKLMEAFNWMRKKPLWKEWVHAGEFGVEATRNENGLHIHLHSLVFVKKGFQNRNQLHAFILDAWNRQTVDPQATREKFTDEELQAIKKGNKLLTDADVNHLNPKGSTLIGLESIYTYSKKGAKKYVQPKFDANGDVSNFDAIMPAIMECLKYHFEPLALKHETVDEETGEVTQEYDLSLLQELLPKIFRKPLYKKFGAFHGVKQLNINQPKNKKEELEQLKQEAKDNAHDTLINPVTLQETTPEHCSYFIANAASIYHVYEDHSYKPLIRRDAIKQYFKQIPNTDYAVNVMMEYAVDRGQINSQGYSSEEFAYVDPEAFPIDMFTNLN